MRVSQYSLNTLKETPADAEVISHQLMLRAGLIRKLASGLYTWLPLGLRVLQKVEKIIREEMNRAGALEVLMPTLIPAELWQESERWQKYGSELLRFKDRHEREFCYGPTHEEVITDLARRELSSYKQLPINYYQIQLKFRDEIRPRFGVMRAREFIMKDAYSFHISEKSLDETYRAMYQAYSNIFTRLGLKFRAVRADSGAIGGDASQEFHVLADSGEDAIVFSTDSDYAANLEMAEALETGSSRPVAKAKLQTVDTPNQHSIEDLAKFLNVPAKQCVKTLFVKGTKSEVVALLLRGDHTLNEVKASKLPEVQQPLQFADTPVVQKITSCMPGSLGPIGLKIPVIADKAVINLADFVCGANEDGKHYTGANWERDLPIPKIADIRNVVEGDLSPDGKGSLKIARGIEVGHIFKLGQKYSQAMQATVLDEAGKSVVMQMGCYGIGVTRVVAAAIEQNHDDSGIKWPTPIAPFQIALIPINMHKSPQVKETADKLYKELTESGYEVLMDDRDARPGFKFADMELIGIPHRIVIGDKSLENGEVEYKNRDGSLAQNIALGQLSEFLKKLD